ncbi:MATE family efflux transporter [candidate division WOR-3 bacterium]|nr:MATE family efflux transporter [candidate division WOR-3 bacterium]
MIINLYFVLSFQKGDRKINQRTNIESGTYLTINRDQLHRNIFSLAWPSISESLLHTITMMVDMIMVSRLGTVSIAAVGLSNMLAFSFFSTTGFPLRIAAQALTARFAGAHLPEKIRDAGSNVLGLGILIGLLISLLGIFGSKWLLFIMGASESVQGVGTGYLRIVLGIALFRIIFFICSGIQKGMGDTRTPMFIMLFANILNVIFNYFLIFGIGIFPRLGVLGAGIATGGAHIFAGVSLFIIMLFARKEIPIKISDIGKFNTVMIKNIWRIGFPAVIETGLRRFGLLVFMRMVTALGTIALAAHQLTVRIEAFSFMIGVGFSVVSNTLVGQSIGAKKPSLASESIKKTSYYGIGLMSLLSFVFAFIPGIILKIFNPEIDVKLLAMLSLMICAFEQIPIGLYMVLAGGFQGAGDTKTPMFITGIGTLLIRIPLAYLFGFRMGLGFVGVWIGTAISWWVIAILALIAFHIGKWRKVKIE